jgi:hypothetical protein
MPCMLLMGIMYLSVLFFKYLTNIKPSIVNITLIGFYVK